MKVFHSACVRSNNFRELEVFGLAIVVVASVVTFDERIRCYCVVLIVIINNIRVFENSSVCTAKQILISYATGFFHKMWRMMRYRCSCVVSWSTFFVIVCHRCATCSHAASWLMESFSKAEFVEEGKAFVEFSLELFLRQWKMRLKFCITCRRLAFPAAQPLIHDAYGLNLF